MVNNFFFIDTKTLSRAHDYAHARIQFFRLHRCVLRTHSGGRLGMSKGAGAFTHKYGLLFIVLAAGLRPALRADGPRKRLQGE